MTQAKTFAPTRERDEHGWIIYPRDTTLRRDLYPPELLEKIMTHPAKQQGYACIDIVNYISNPGDTILDPFGGVGTALLAATMGRNVRLIELEGYYYGIIEQCIEHLRETGVATGKMFAVQGDNRLVMPLSCDHIITSPPYGNDLFQGATGASSGTSTRKLGGTVEAAEKNAAMMAQYGQNNQNIGRLNPFLYQQSMKKVYELMVRSVRPGGFIAITHRDRMKEGERILYVDSIVGSLVKLGCRVEHLDKWKVPATMQASVNKNLGAEVVEDEDIIIMRKEN